MILNKIIQHVFYTLEETKVPPSAILISQQDYSTLVEDVSVKCRLATVSYSNGTQTVIPTPVVSDEQSDIFFVKGGELKIGVLGLFKLVVLPNTEIKLLYSFDSIRIQIADPKTIYVQEALTYYSTLFGAKDPYELMGNLYPTNKIRLVMSGKYKVDTNFAHVLASVTGRSEDWWKKLKRK